MRETGDLRRRHFEHRRHLQAAGALQAARVRQEVEHCRGSGGGDRAQDGAGEFLFFKKHMILRKTRIFIALSFSGSPASARRSALHLVSGGQPRRGSQPGEFF